MSSALYSAVPNALTGPNYLEWAQAMQSFLMSQGQWAACTQSPPQDVEEAKEYRKEDVRAQGNLRLRLAPSVVSAIDGKTSAKDIWDQLKDTYGKPGVPIVYQDFRAALALSIPGDSNPIPALDKLEAHFQRLETNKFTVAEHVKGMILMAKLPAAMDSTIQVYIAGLKPSGTKTAIETVTLADVRQAVILQWEQRQGRHGGRQTNANKLSAIKRKGPDPAFRQQQQQRPQGQQQQQQRPQGQQHRGRPRGMRSGRGRGQQGQHQHAHFAHIADIEPTTKGPDAAKDPRALLNTPVREHIGDNQYPSLTRALALAEDLGIPPTFERLRTLEKALESQSSTDSSITSSEKQPSFLSSMKEDMQLDDSARSASRTPTPLSDTRSTPSRTPSPTRSGTAALVFGKRTSTHSSVAGTSDLEDLPKNKRKRTLKERVAPTLIERMGEPMDEGEDAISLGLSDFEDEVNTFFDKSWYVNHSLPYNELYADCLHPAVTSVAPSSRHVELPVPVATPLCLSAEGNICCHHSTLAECAQCEGKGK